MLNLSENQDYLPALIYVAVVMGMITSNYIREKKYRKIIREMNVSHTEFKVKTIKFISDLAAQNILLAAKNKEQRERLDNLGLKDV